MKGLSVWGFHPLCPQSLFRAGVHTLRRSRRQCHVYTGQLSAGVGRDPSLVSSGEVNRLVLAWAEAEPALLTWGGAHFRTAVLQPQSWVQPD